MSPNEISCRVKNTTGPVMTHGCVLGLVDCLHYTASSSQDLAYPREKGYNEYDECGRAEPVGWVWSNVVLETR